MGVEILDGNSGDRESRDLKRYGRKGTRLVEPRDQRRALGRLGTGEFFFLVWVMGTWLTSEEL